MEKDKELVVYNKNNLLEEIRNWIHIDDQLKLINEKIKILRNRKTELTNNICEYVSNNNNIKNNINIKGGELKITKKNDYKPLTFSYIETCLGNLITDKKQVEFIIKYLKDNRETTCSHEIRRNYDK